MAELEIFKKIKTERNKVANIHKVFECFPEAVDGHFYFYQKVILNDGPLTRGERELIAVLVSEENQCEYCIRHHGEALKVYHLEVLQERIDFFQKLAKVISKEPWKASLLKDEATNIGMTASEYAHAIMVASYFNMANRLIYGMNIELEDSFEESCY